MVPEVLGLAKRSREMGIGYSLFYPLPSRWREASPEATEFAVRMLFGEVPGRPPNGPSKAVWVTRHADPDGRSISISFAPADAERVSSEWARAVRVKRSRARERTAIAWALADGSPPDGFEVVLPIFTRVGPDTSRREIYIAWQVCQRVARRLMAKMTWKSDQRWNRGLRYWLMRYGITDMPAAWQHLWQLDGDIPHYWLALALSHYLEVEPKPPRRRMEEVVDKIASEKGKDNFSVEMVRRDIVHFLGKARSVRLAHAFSLGELLRRVERESPAPPRRLK